MRLYMERICNACNEPYKIWFWQDSMERLHHCSDRCRLAFAYGYHIGIKTSTWYGGRHRFIAAADGTVADRGVE